MEGTTLPVTHVLRHQHGFMKSIAAVVLVAFVSLYLQPLALAAQLPSAAPAAKTAPASNEEKLSRTLEDIEDRLAKYEDRLARREDATREKDEIKRLRQNLDELDRQALADFEKIGKHLKDKNLPKVILDRHAEAVNTYKAEMAALKAGVDDIEKAPKDEDKKLKARKAKEYLKAKQRKASRAPIGPNDLPTRVLKPKRDNKPKLKKEDFVRAGLVDNPYIRLATHGSFRIDQLPGASDPAYLAATPEIVLSNAIRAKAEELEHSPVKIYQWVRNNIEWVPSWGSIQGSELTLRSLKGNSVDTASLLIALLRASDIPARYVHGTIEVRADRLMNWAGGFTDANSAWDFVSSGGVPITGIVSGGRVTAFRMEHVWVEAAIDLQPSRGAINKSADSWVAIDASFKQHDINPGFDVTVDVPFDSNSYLSAVRVQGPVAYYHQQIQNFLEANSPEKTVADAMGYLLIRLDTSSVLPSALSNRIVIAANRYGTLPASMRTTVQLAMNTPGAIEPEVFTLSTSDVAGKRLTLSYLPSSASDEATIAKFGGDMYAVPPYLLYLTPTLKVDGAIIYQAAPLQMGQEHSLVIAYSSPTIRAQSIPHKLISGGYYAVGLNLQGVNYHVLGNKNARLIETLTTLTAETASQDVLIGEHLTGLMLMWFMSNDKLYQGAGKLYRVATERALSAGLAGFAPTVRYFFGIPRSASVNRAQFDVGLEVAQAASLDGSIGKRNAYLELHGLTGSFNEHSLWEAIHGFESVSAVKGLQAANAQGVPVYTINQSNFDLLFPLLQLAAEDEQEIQQGVQAGLVALVPQREITINDWTGTGFILKDPQTHSGVYRISGGLAGGSSTKQADGWQIVSLFKGAFAWLFDRIDVMTRRSIATVAEIDAVIGEKIAETAEELAETEAGYENVNQCSGLVRRAYAAAGICLDYFNGSGNCKDNLVQRLGIPGKNGVLYHYNLANTLNINNSVRQSNDPLIGDIVFFSNTSGPGNPLNHEGIVVTGPSSDGTVEFVHATAKRGAYRSRMNIVKVLDSPRSEDFIGSFCERGKGIPDCLAGSLFDGYGTIRDPKVLERR